MSSIADASMLGSTRDVDGMGSEDNTLSFNDSDFYLNMDDVDIGPQIGQGAFSKVHLGRYLGQLVSYFSHFVRTTMFGNVITLLSRVLNVKCNYIYGHCGAVFTQPF